MEMRNSMTDEEELKETPDTEVTVEPSLEEEIETDPEKEKIAEEECKKTKKFGWLKELLVYLVIIILCVTFVPKYVMEQLEQGNDVLLEIEMQGALKIKEKFPEVSLIFITPPSVEELKNRLINRGTETMEVIEKRVKRAAQECVYMQEYNYIVENDSLEVCIEQIHALLQSIHFENKNQKNLIENIRKDFDQYR